MNGICIYCLRPYESHLPLCIGWEEDIEEVVKKEFSIAYKAMIPSRLWPKKEVEEERR